MEKQKATNRELDNMGIALLQASVLREEELEQAIENPYLFSSVKRRIRLEASFGPKAKRSRFSLVSLRPVAGILSMAVVAVTVFGLASLKFWNRPSTEAVRIQQPEVASNPTVAVLPDEEVSHAVEPAPVVDTPRRAYQAEPAVIRTRAARRSYTEPVAVAEQDAKTMEFYPLAGTSPDTMGEGRIVRVELPRASLVALGANLPPDSGKSLVKTDLLVGQDGIPRAIRLVD